MPIFLGHDKEGTFARWGHKGAKYYYEKDSEISKKHAKEKALKQGVAIGDFPPKK